MRPLRKKHLLLFTIVLSSMIYLNIFSYLFQKDFYTEFDYPLEGNVAQFAQELRNGDKPSVPPINGYNYSFIMDCKPKCWNDDERIRPRLVFIVKSAMQNHDRRVAIRVTWGYEHRFSDVIIRTVFMLGVKQDDPELQARVSNESATFRDIIQADFIDDYYNNTIKTMMGFRWAATMCPHSQFYMFVDDDMYVSAKNILRFIRNPVHYPGYLKRPEEALRHLARQNRNVLQYRAEVNNNSIEPGRRRLRQLIDFELPADVVLFAGFVFFDSSPFRIRSSKWYVSLEEYGWHRWPPYVTAGAFVLSREALLNLYYASFFTKHFRFDDIFLGLVALKAGIEPLHNDEFHFYPAHYKGTDSYRYVLSSHGYGNPKQLRQVWTEARSAGHA